MEVTKQENEIALMVCPEKEAVKGNPKKASNANLVASGDPGRTGPSAAKVAPRIAVQVITTLPIIINYSF